MDGDHQRINVLLIEGIALLLVMFVHSGTPNFIYAPMSYGIASFIFARGYQWRERRFAEFFRSRVRLITTYYWAGLINTALFLAVVPSKFLPAPKLEYFKNFLLCRLDRLDRIPINIVPTWFLTMLFFAELYYHLLRKNKILLYVAMAASILLRLFPHEPWPLKLDTALLAVPFFHIGALWRERELEADSLAFTLSCFGLVLITVANGDISWNTMAFGRNGLIAVLGEFLTIPAIVFPSVILRGSKLEPFFLKLSMNALFVLSYHFLIGSLLALPFVILTSSYSNPVSVLHRVWFLHFPIVLAVVLIIISKVPRRLLGFLTGDFLLPAPGVRRGRRV